MYTMKLGEQVSTHDTLDEAVAAAVAVHQDCISSTGASGGACHNYTHLWHRDLFYADGRKPIGIIAHPGYEHLAAPCPHNWLENYCDLCGEIRGAS